MLKRMIQLIKMVSPMSDAFESGTEQGVWLCHRCGGVRNTGSPSVVIKGNKYDRGCVPDDVIQAVDTDIDGGGS